MALKGVTKKFQQTGLLDYDFRKLYNKIEALDEDYNNDIKKAVKNAAEEVRLSMKTQVSKGHHYYSGNTKKSLQNKNEVQVENSSKGVIKCEVGFKRSEGGAVAYWLERGTPRMPAYKLISKSAKSVRAKETLSRDLQNALDKKIKKSY